MFNISLLLETNFLSARLTDCSLSLVTDSRLSRRPGPGSEAVRVSGKPRADFICFLMELREGSLEPPSALCEREEKPVLILFVILSRGTLNFCFSRVNTLGLAAVAPSLAGSVFSAGPGWLPGAAATARR